MFYIFNRLLRLRFFMLYPVSAKHYGRGGEERMAEWLTFINFLLFYFQTPNHGTLVLQSPLTLNPLNQMPP